MHESIRPDEWKALNHLKSCMSLYDVGSKEYRIAQASFRFMCENVRRREKSYVVTKKMDGIAANRKSPALTH